MDIVLAIMCVSLPLSILAGVIAHRKGHPGFWSIFLSLIGISLVVALLVSTNWRNARSIPAKRFTVPRFCSQHSNN